MSLGSIYHNGNLPVQCALYDPINDRILLGSDENAFIFGGSETSNAMLYKSGRDDAELLGIEKSYYKLWVSYTGSIDLVVYIDGVEVKTYSLHNGDGGVEEMYLPASTYGEDFQFKASGEGSLKMVRYEAEERQSV